MRMKIDSRLVYASYRERTITYVVYPPNYHHSTYKENPYFNVETKAKAFKLALKLGNDAEVIQCIKRINRHGAGDWNNTIGAWEVIHDKYFDEVMRKGRYLKLEDKTVRVCNINRKYVPIYRKRK